MKPSIPHVKEDSAFYAGAVLTALLGCTALVILVAALHSRPAGLPPDTPSCSAGLEHFVEEE